MKKWWYWSSKKLSANPWDLDATFMKLTPKDRITIAEACMGMIILGATGAGKTSGPGAALALACLRLGMGGLILCVKPGERQLFERYCKIAGRSDDLIVFDASGKHRFSFLGDEINRTGAGAGFTENLLNLLCNVLEITERSSGESNSDDQGFWRRASRQLMRNTIELLVLAKGQMTVPELYRLVISAPTSRQQLTDEGWKSKSFCFQCLRDAEKATKTKRQQHDFELVADYFMFEFPNLSEKTRSVTATQGEVASDRRNQTFDLDEEKPVIGSTLDQRVPSPSEIQPPDRDKEQERG